LRRRRGPAYSGTPPSLRRSRCGEPKEGGSETSISTTLRNKKKNIASMEEREKGNQRESGSFWETLKKGKEGKRVGEKGC